jgi:hypothetical protein
MKLLFGADPEFLNRLSLSLAYIGQLSESECSALNGKMKILTQ